MYSLAATKKTVDVESVSDKTLRRALREAVNTGADEELVSFDA